MLEEVDFEGHAPFERLATRLAGERHFLRVSNHVLANMSHGKEFLPAYLTSEFFLSVTVDDFIVLV